MKILVIEDEMSLLDAIKIRLIKEKYDVDTCIDEKEKLEQLVKDIMENCYKLDVPLVVEMYTTDEEGNEVDLINVEDPQLKVMMPYYKEIETTKKAELQKMHEAIEKAEKMLDSVFAADAVVPQYIQKIRKKEGQ